MIRVTAGRLARLTVAAALVAYTFRASDPHEVFAVTRRAAPGLLAAAVALVIVDRTLMAWRWFALLRPLDRAGLPHFVEILRIFFVSTFVGSFLPASVGGDAVRAYGLSKHRVDMADAVASVLVDRLLGVASLLLVAVAGLFLVPDLALDPGVRLALTATGVGCAAAAALIFSRKAEDLAAGWLARLPSSFGRGSATAVLSAVRRYAAHHRALGLVLIASVAVQVIRIVEAYCLGLALGVGQPLGTYFAFVPLILLLMLLPVTVNGLGTSQAAFVWLFGGAGTPSAEAFALSVLFVALGIVGNLPGALLYPSGRLSRVRAEERP